MQGIYIDGRRPASKKQVREAALENASRVALEATSPFGNEYDGPLSEAPAGDYTFVGPDPYDDRRFYGRIRIGTDGGVRVS